MIRSVRRLAQLTVAECCLLYRVPRSSAEDAALGEAMVASKREEMDREIDHLLITQSENLRRYWEVGIAFSDWATAFA